MVRRKKGVFKGFDPNHEERGLVIHFADSIGSIPPRDRDRDRDGINILTFSKNFERSEREFQALLKSIPRSSLNDEVIELIREEIFNRDVYSVLYVDRSKTYNDSCVAAQNKLALLDFFEKMEADEEVMRELKKLTSDPNVLRVHGWIIEKSPDKCLFNFLAVHKRR